MSNLIRIFKIYVFYIFYKLKIYDLISKKINIDVSRKKILILGSGPSLELLNKSDLNDYDYIFAINDSIKYLKGINFDNIYFFTCDVKKVRDILRLTEIDHKKFIIPMQLFLPFYLIYFLFKKNTYAIIPKYHIEMTSIKSLNFLIPFPKVVMQNKLTHFNKTTSVFPYSSVFTLLHYCINHKVSSVEMFGVDLSDTYFNGSNNNLEKAFHKTEETYKLMASFESEFVKNNINFKRHRS